MCVLGTQPCRGCCVTPSDPEHEAPSAFPRHEPAGSAALTHLPNAPCPGHVAVASPRASRCGRGQDTEQQAEQVKCCLSLVRGPWGPSGAAWCEVPCACAQPPWTGGGPWTVQAETPRSPASGDSAGRLLLTSPRPRLPASPRPGAGTRDP